MKKWQICILTCGFLTTAVWAQSPEDMLHEVNQARSQARQCGGQGFVAVPPLKLNAALQRAAQKHADDMAQKGYFSHQSQDGRTPFQRIQAEGYAFWNVAENISYGHATAERAIQSWLRSPNHCRNLMSADVTEMGMAQQGKYWVQVFAKPR